MNKRKRNINEIIQTENVIQKNLLQPIGKIPFQRNQSSHPSLANKTIRCGQLFSSGDFLEFRNADNTQILLHKEVIYYLNPRTHFLSLSSSWTNYCAEICYLKDKQHNKLFIFYTLTGSLVFLLVYDDHRVSNVEYQLNFEEGEEIITSISALGTFLFLLFSPLLLFCLVLLLLI